MHHQPPMSPRITINIVDSRLPKFVRITIMLIVVIVMPISLGVLLNSPAMQWVGFAFTLLAVIAMVQQNDVATKFDSVDAAKAYLDKIR